MHCKKVIHRLSTGYPQLIHRIPTGDPQLMRGMPHRKPVNKGRSAGNFKKNVKKTHPFNVKMAPRRGGWRL